jgi:hypothetical protein
VFVAEAWLQFEFIEVEVLMNSVRGEEMKERRRKRRRKRRRNR